MCLPVAREINPQVRTVRASFTFSTSNLHKSHQSSNIKMGIKGNFDKIIQPPNKSQLEAIKTELGEDEERMEHSLKLLEEWISFQPHFPKNYDKSMVRSFLRGSKHNLDKTKRKLEYYFVSKSVYPKIYANRTFSSNQIKESFKNVNIVLLPKLDEKGNRICVFSSNNNDVESFDMELYIKIFFMIYDICLAWEQPVAGDIAVFDAKGFTASHLVKFFAPSIMKTLTVVLRESYSIRLKEMHVINLDSSFVKLINGIKPLMHKNVRNRFIIHKDNKSLHEWISPELLPKEYDGKQGGFQELATNIQEFLIENKEWFSSQENVKIDGVPPKKMEGILYFDESVGIQGSFRQLSID